MKISYAKTNVRMWTSTQHRWFFVRSISVFDPYIVDIVVWLGSLCVAGRLLVLNWEYSKDKARGKIYYPVVFVQTCSKWWRIRTNTNRCVAECRARPAKTLNGRLPANIFISCMKYGSTFPSNGVQMARVCPVLVPRCRKNLFGK